MADAIFIVGYYRSGTSALSGALQRMGVKFYNEAAPNEHNPLGFFEIPELIDFDARLFSHLGVDWPDVRGLPDGWINRSDITPFTAQLEEIIRKRFLAQDRVWGLKHPHLCRTLPLYEKAAKRAGHTPHVIHIFRNPWISAASQCYKNGLSRAHALLLWLTYATNAEKQARHIPRTWLTYHDLLTNPAEQLLRIEAELKIKLQDSKHDTLSGACAYLTNQLDRSKPLSHEQLCHPLSTLVNRVWDAIQSRQFEPELWNDFSEETADLVGFLTEIASSKACALSSFNIAPHQAGVNLAISSAIRPVERTDACAQHDLVRMRASIGQLPRVAILIVAPAGRAHAVSETLESLDQQWEKPALIEVLTVDPLTIESVLTLKISAEVGVITKHLCTQLNQHSDSFDYIAILNAGDTIAPDACLRFSLLAAQTKADMLYSDEIVPNGGNGWIRYKPNWDITRLRQAAYIGDWVWYNCRSVLAAGGFNPDMAGAEEYDLQLRFAARNVCVERLPEAVFTRSVQSRRDDISSDVFCTRARDALVQHLIQTGLAADVQNRQFPGLFHHMRLVADPGTTIIMLCDGGDISTIDKWLTALLSGKPLTGPIILVGAEMSLQLQTYLFAITEHQNEIQGKVLAVTAPSPGEALSKAFGLAKTEHIAILDARMQDVTPYWLEQLRSKLADQNVVAVGARTITPLGADGKQAQVMGPVILGADTRMGAEHGPLDPGPGGWLLVDQEASAITPPGLLIRHAALASCQISASLHGDALWVDLCAQLRAGGAKLVWTPDVSFVMPAAITVEPPASNHHAPEASVREICPEDPYHHPALSLHGDLLAAEKRTGLVRATPSASFSLLLTGDNKTGSVILNAARTLRREKFLNIDWAPGLPSASDLNRRAPHAWVRMNPSHPPLTTSMPYTAIYTFPPDAEALKTLGSANKIFATSASLAKYLRKHTPHTVPVEIWQPALSGWIWKNFKTDTGLNTKPRVLWVDEGIEPLWFQDLINQTTNLVSWMIVKHPVETYGKNVTFLPHPESEQGWAELFAVTAPQIMLRPAKADTQVDTYLLLLAAASGCRLIIDHRLDVPKGLDALPLPRTQQSWTNALNEAVAHLDVTIRQGAQTRTAVLTLPTLEQAPPGWISPEMLTELVE